MLPIWRAKPNEFCQLLPRCREYSGEDTPGGSTPTPDQSNIDEIGRVYGLAEEDSGALQTAGEILSRRDRRRPELKAPSKPRS